MPTYEYECSACNHAFEALQSMSEPKLTKCPKCGKKKLQRLIGSGSGMIFKGSGFYETDYKRKGETTPADKPAAPKPAGGCGCSGGHSCGS
jgi:putative FmdB family regulatory protein